MLHVEQHTFFTPPAPGCATAPVEWCCGGRISTTTWSRGHVGAPLWSSFASCAAMIQTVIHSLRNSKDGKHAKIGYRRIQPVKLCKISTWCLISIIVKSTSLTQIPSSGILVISIKPICIGLHNQQPTEILDIVQLEQSFCTWKQQPVTTQWQFQPCVNHFIHHCNICKAIQHHI